MGRDWMTILTCAIWFTVLLIMCLAKLKAFHHFLIFSVLGVTMAIYNIEDLTSYYSHTRSYKLFMVFRHQLKKEFAFCALACFLVLTIINAVNVMTETNFLCFGWVYQLTSIAIYLMSLDHK